MKKKVFAICAVSLVAIALIFTFLRPPQRFSTHFFQLFDTYSEFTAYAKNQNEFIDISQKMYVKLEEYHRLLDIYNQYPEFPNIALINEQAGKAPVAVCPQLVEFLLYAVDMYEKSGKTVNIAMGSVLSLWHESRQAGVYNPSLAKLPEWEDLEKASLVTNLSDLVIDKEKNTVFLTKEGMSLDCGALAKGYVADKIADYLVSIGVTDFILNLGGNVVAKGSDGGEKWAAGIQNPVANSEKSSIATVYLDNKSLVTSGDYQRFFTVDGVNYNHIIDPVTLFPAKNFSSVTICAETSALADMLSTALFVLPLDEGLELLKSMEGSAAAMYITQDMEIIKSPNFDILTQ